jgi:hypothetical protein
MPRWLGRLGREPLVHFALLGAALFSVDAALEPAATGIESGAATGGDMHRITVTPALRTELAEESERIHGVAPTDEELKAIVTRWVETEVLYREGLARDLDRDDPLLRDRVARKMRHILAAEAVLPDPTEAQLRAWYEAHRDEWSEEVRVDFTHVFVDGHDAEAEAEVERLHERLVEGASPSGLGDTFSGGRRYRRRTPDALAESFGPEFVQGMEPSSVGRWELRRSSYGLHVVHLDRWWPARVTPFEEARAEVAEVWRANEREAALRQRIETLTRRYDRIEATP